MNQFGSTLLPKTRNKGPQPVIQKLKKLWLQALVANWAYTIYKTNDLDTVILHSNCIFKKDDSISDQKSLMMSNFLYIIN